MAVYQVNLPRGTKKANRKKLRFLEELFRHKVRGVSPEAGKRVYGEKDLWKRSVLSREWKREVVMDGESGELTEWEEVVASW